MRINVQRWLLGTLSLLVVGSVQSLSAATPTAEDALQLQPVQKDVEFDRPTKADAAKATIKAEKISGQTGWVVRSADGQILRRFVDTNNDNVVDQWCYYLAGIEVYRDIDQNFNGKADQYRWLNTAGTRWALDTNEDGRIDSWKLISMEEVSAEVVRAVAERDRERFNRLLLTSDEIAGLGLGSDEAKKLGELVDKAPDRFKSFLAAQGSPGSKLASFGSKMKWVNFGGSQPGLIPAGTNGSSKDLIVYQNTAAMIQNDDKHEQMPIGTLVKVGESWRLVLAPPQGEDNADQLALNGVFPVFPTTGNAAAGTTSGNTGGGSEGAQELLRRLEELDKKLASAPANDQPRLNTQRADLMEQIAEAAAGDDRALWFRQLADTVSAAAQNGSYPDGVKRLQALQEKLASNSADAEVAAFVEFRQMAAEYGVGIANGNFIEVQKTWLDRLRKYVEKYPKQADTAEAMLQLAMAEEFAGQEDEAKRWYGQIAVTFSDSAAAKKAVGAKARLESVGKVIDLKGTTVAGQKFALSGLRGKVVVLHYWATWSPPCVAELATIKDLQAKYGKDGLAICSVSLDESRAALKKFLDANKLPWTVIYEDGGLESPLANALGILTMPSMLLIDKDGKVVNRNIHVTELDGEVGKLLRK